MATMLILLAVAALLFDMRKDIIPNRLVFFGMGIGAVFRTVSDIMAERPLDILAMVLEAFLLFFCLWPVFATGGLGAGDCKLLLMAGVFLPVKQAVFVIVSTFFIAAAESILLILFFGIRKEKRKVTAIHFAPAFLLAVLSYQFGKIF